MAVPVLVSSAGEVLASDATIGREGCDVVLADAEVSRRHAAFRLDATGAVIEDLESTNGTFVNERRIQGPRRLTDGDVVRIGSTVWRVETPADRSAPEPRADPPTPEPPIAPTPEERAEPGRAGHVGTPPPPEPGEPVAPSSDEGRRGDVPPPVPSAIQRIPVELTQAPPSFDAPSRRGRGSAARRVEATVLAFAVVLVTAVLVIVYLAFR